MTHVSRRFLIVHRDLLCGQALTEAVSALSRLSACEPVITSVDALACVQQQAPDVLLVDWDLPAAAAAALVREVLQHHATTRVIVFGVGVGDVFTLKCSVIRQDKGM